MTDDQKKYFMEGILFSIDDKIYQVDTLCQKNPYLFALKEVSDRLGFDYESSTFGINK